MHIHVSGLHKRFEDKHVLKDISFTVEEGQFVALLGPSGCGKTTLLNILAGFLDVDAGSVAVGGQVWSSVESVLPPERRQIGMVFQDFALWPHMTVYENVAFGLKLRKKSAQDIAIRVQEVLATVRMDGYKEAYPHQLSGGQKQRIAIARALAPAPAVMLMDEPLSSLDAKLREQMRWDLLDIIRQAGTTTIYVTHDQSEALSMADKIVLLNEGKIEQEGSAKELYEQPRTAFAASFMGASNLIKGTVERVSDQSLALDCYGHVVGAMGVGKIGEVREISIRPTDIALAHVPTEREQHTNLSGTIVQRAFHGANWRYRIALTGSPQVLVEAWDHGEWQTGEAVHLSIPFERCLVLEHPALSGQYVTA